MCSIVPSVPKIKKERININMSKLIFSNGLGMPGQLNVYYDPADKYLQDLPEVLMMKLLHMKMN